MAVENNPELGRVDCQGCEGECSVHQTKRGKGQFLYTRCSNCGVDQRTGPAVQTRLWNETRWRDGVEKKKPINAKEADWTPESKKPVEQPNETTEKTTETTKQNKVLKSGSKPDFTKVVAVVGVVSVVGGLIAFRFYKPKQTESEPKVNPYERFYQ